jgi:hypothetical protein
LLGPIDILAAIQTIEHFQWVVGNPMKNPYAAPPDAPPTKYSNIETPPQKRQKSPEGPLNQCFSVLETGAGEAIRTPDPNLGNGGIATSLRSAIFRCNPTEYTAVQDFCGLRLFAQFAHDGTRAYCSEQEWRGVTATGMEPGGQNGREAEVCCNSETYSLRR